MTLHDVFSSSYTLSPNLSGAKNTNWRNSNTT